MKKIPPIPCETCSRPSSFFMRKSFMQNTCFAQICEKCFKAEDIDGSELRRLFNLPGWIKMDQEEYVVQQVME